MIISICGPHVKSPQRGRKSGYFGGEERTHSMQCVASNAFVWRWRDHHNPVENERAPFERGESLQEVNIHTITVPPITTLLGITLQEYAHVIHRLPVDRRIRDQIAYKLGIRWSAIAEFMPEAALPWLEIASIPAPAGAPPPAEPWYLVHETTGRIVSGPHDAPLPGNAVYLCDPLTQRTTNLVVLFAAWTSEEAQLQSEGYSAHERRIMEEERAEEDKWEDETYRAMLDESVHVPDRAARMAKRRRTRWKERRAHDHSR